MTVLTVTVALAMIGAIINIFNGWAWKTNNSTIKLATWSKNKLSWAYLVQLHWQLEVKRNYLEHVWYIVVVCKCEVEDGADVVLPYAPTYTRVVLENLQFTMHASLRLCRWVVNIILYIIDCYNCSIIALLFSFC